MGGGESLSLKEGKEAAAIPKRKKKNELHLLFLSLLCCCCQTFPSSLRCTRQMENLEWNRIEHKGRSLMSLCVQNEIEGNQKEKLRKTVRNYIIKQ